MRQAAVCVFSYAVFVSFSFLASRKAFFRAPCRLICAAYRQSSEQYLTLFRVVVNTLPQFSQVHARLRPSAASRRLTFSFMISKIRMIPPFLRKNGGLPNLGQAAVCVFSYAVFVSSSFLASRKAFFRAPCRLICAAYRQSSLQYFTFDLVVINSLPQFSQVHARLRLSAASCR